ncbi:MAG TPA: zinc ribbon domain-containing protein [Thiobacillaceae bacterium]|nr:zinc ribbon domain-containing protein [Thiobacillaceae bacterium]HNU65175.1 zinc ribbon domain-containing protein [Thiobacillaceae bacterium]
MPIYAYKCADCGFEQDVMQKISDAPLTDCPQCGKAHFGKQLTAAGIQLKGGGDYRNAPAMESAAPSCGNGGCGHCSG